MMSRVTLSCCALLLIWPCSTDHPVAQTAAPEIVRGITLSTHGIGLEWALDDNMAPAFREIRSLGAGWVAIHPYAGIAADGTVRYEELDPDDPPLHVVRPIQLAHELGLKIMIKPHLAYWRSPFRWRGDIEFDRPEEWRRFFDSYERWIVALAAAAREADGFVVGTELDRTIEHEAEWRRLIAGVRERTDAPITYAANWTDFERVPFWDALDVIGIQAYFPLTDEGVTDEASIRAGWDRRMSELRDYAARHYRNIVFTELGYDRSLRAPWKPWEPARDEGDAAVRLQTRCLRIALEAIRREAAVVGVFLWKWFPEPHPVGRDFPLADAHTKSVIREAWSTGGP